MRNVTKLLICSLLLAACQNGNVEIRQVALDVDGIAFAGIFANFKTRSLHNFSVTGLCQSDVERIYYRFDENQPWQEIDPSKIKCATQNTFAFDFQSDLGTIKQASGYTYNKDRKGKYPTLDFEFYGKTGAYPTRTVPLRVTHLLETGKGGLTPSPETTLASNDGSFKIRGKLTAFGQSSTLISESREFKIRQGTLRTHNR